MSFKTSRRSLPSAGVSKTTSPLFFSMAHHFNEFFVLSRALILPSALPTKTFILPSSTSPFGFDSFLTVGSGRPLLFGSDSIGRMEDFEGNNKEIAYIFIKCLLVNVTYTYNKDGSCNGLQHYAALGRDSLEAAAVNLVASERPADVYSEIAVRVHDIMRRDSNKDPAVYPNALLARVLIDQIDRKLVKQTVMTSVYGVTFVGAREQMKRRLQEKGLINDEQLLFTAACYAAKVTLTALGEIFGAARVIMGWLGDCAKVITSENHPVSWTTPLGLPVIQPYCKTERHLVSFYKT
ncbi:hypothetical protein V8G54_014042 [Vigna mungo]|uniref:DNA-directed RNA polymerase n=1 Tax=Vigna mungo TaxID=3915 RepID=A0AAQ3RX39_VIGMU